MLILDRKLVGSIKFVLTRLAAAVDAELNDDGALREQLLQAQMRYELGQLSEEAQAEARRAREHAQAELEQLRRRVVQLEEEAPAERRRADGSLAAELAERLRVRERGIDELRDAAVRHAEELRAREAELAERGA